MITNDKTVTSSSHLLRMVADFISILFHPLFITCYLVVFLLYLNPSSAAGMTDREKLAILLPVAFNTVFLPVFALFLMRRLKLVSSVYMPTQRDRIFPITATMIFYFWVWYVSANSHYPVLVKQVLLSGFFGVCAVWIANIFFKISMHAVSMGSLATFLLMVSLAEEDGSGLYISLAFVVAGIVCTARLIVSDHKTGDIYAGLVAGVLCQLAAAYWYS